MGNPVVVVRFKSSAGLAGGAHQRQVERWGYVSEGALAYADADAEGDGADFETARHRLRRAAYKWAAFLIARRLRALGVPLSPVVLDALGLDGPDLEALDAAAAAGRVLA